MICSYYSNEVGDDSEEKQSDSGDVLLSDQGMCACACVYVFVPVCMCVYLCVCVCMCVCLCVPVFIHKCVLLKNSVVLCVYKLHVKYVVQGWASLISIKGNH